MRTIKGDPLGEEFNLSVTLRMESGEVTQEGRISDFQKAVNGVAGVTEDVLAYEAAKLMKRCARKQAHALAKRNHPEITDERELRFIWMATLNGGEMLVREPGDVIPVDLPPMGRLYHLNCAWLQVGYAWTGVYMAVYELWRAIRGL